MRGVTLKIDFRNVNFKYKKQKIDFVSGDIYKGKKYRCNYIRFNTLYEDPASGSENVLIYNYQPKGEIKASTLILHGLGSRNINYLFWMGPYLASRGINASFLILPGNYSRVEHDSVSGRSYLYPDLENQYRFWENAVVDVMSTIDFLEQENLWSENNLLVGYCLGGMVATIVSALEKRINHTLFVATGGHIAGIMYDSPAAVFVPRLIQKGLKADYHMDDKSYLYKRYIDDLSLIRNMSLDEIITSKDIHPILKIDPLSYGHLLDVSKLTYIDALFDKTLPEISNKWLLDEMKGIKTIRIPNNHVNWLPMTHILARYINFKLHHLGKNNNKIIPSKIQNSTDK